MKPLRLVAVTAGTSQPSSTRLLADRLTTATQRQLADAGRSVEVQVVELRELATAIAQNMVTGFPSAELRTALDAVTHADALIAVTPVFTASYSGLFKSFFDVLDHEALVDKPVLIAATAGTARHSLVLDHALRPLFGYLRAITLPTGVFAASEDWGTAGDSRTDGLGERIERAARQLAHHLTQTPAAPRSPDDEVVPFARQLAAVRGT
ncbi:FMN reductase [Streptomyces sp. NPDC057702]|uniref:FMN reductase n=1 Tax=unclassified Streptomyces TaxID=2593676 RepID=UPI00369757CE